jgi:hypothetical protein
MAAWERKGVRGPGHADWARKAAGTHGERLVRPSWAGYRVLSGFGPKRLRGIGKSLSISNLFINFKLIWIKFEFEIWLTSTRKVKYKSTQQFKRKMQATWNATNNYIISKLI